jgi:hypothetical protein
MQKVLISIPDSLAHRLRVIIPDRQRSKVIANLIAEEIERRESSLYSCALEVEKDEALNNEMQEWDITSNDGLENDSW